jgi:hypothetical protein
MSTVRRTYLYAVAAASLLVLSAGIVNLGQALVLAATSGSDRLILSGLRGQVALGGAAAIVGLPVWLLHWTLADRGAHRDAAERAALLRRLYLYAVLATAALAAWMWGTEALDAFLRLAVADASSMTRAALPLPVVVVSAGVCWYHRRAAALDRAAAGERGGAATVRRWYRYGVAFVGLAALLSGAAAVIRLAWETLLPSDAAVSTTGGAVATAAAAAIAVTGLALWLVHWRAPAVAPRGQVAEIERQDAASTLRSVYLFVALALSVVVTLVGAWQVAFYALGRALGVPNPGGAGGSFFLAAAGPASLLLVYGVSWLYQRRALALQAQAQAELPEQAGVRRLYVYLVSLVALAVLAAGAGGLLWTIADLATNAPHASEPTTWWRERVSLFVALAAVGLPVWFLHWRPVAATVGLPEEARSLARRLYVYLALLAGVLALLGAGVVAVKQALDLVLGEATTSAALTNLGRALSVAAVAGLVVAYHQRVLRADVASGRRAAEPPRAATPPADVPSVTERRFGVIVGYPDGREVSSWHVTTQAAEAAYARGARGPADGDGSAWVALVTVEREAHRPAAGEPAAGATREAGESLRAARAATAAHPARLQRQPRPGPAMVQAR